MTDQNNSERSAASTIGKGTYIYDNAISTDANYEQWLMWELELQDNDEMDELDRRHYRRQFEKIYGSENMFNPWFNEPAEDEDRFRNLEDDED